MTSQATLSTSYSRATKIEPPRIQARAEEMTRSKSSGLDANQRRDCQTVGRGRVTARGVGARKGDGRHIVPRRPRKENILIKSKGGRSLDGTGGRVERPERYSSHAGWKIRTRTVSTASLKPFYLSPPDSRHPMTDEFV